MTDYQDVEDLHQNVAHRVVLRKLDDSGKQQLVDYDGLEGEQHTEVMRMRPHGMISNPGADAEGMVVGLGTRDMPVFFGGEHPEKRPKGLPEWAAGFYDGSGLLVYGDGQGNVVIKQAKTIDAEVTGDMTLKVGGTLTITAAKTKWTGDIDQTGEHKDSRGYHT